MCWFFSSISFLTQFQVVVISNLVNPMFMRQVHDTGCRVFVCIIRTSLEWYSFLIQLNHWQFHKAEILVFTIKSNREMTINVCSNSKSVTVFPTKILSYVKQQNVCQCFFLEFGRSWCTILSILEDLQLHLPFFNC